MKMMLLINNVPVSAEMIPFIVKHSGFVLQLLIQDASLSLHRAIVEKLKEHFTKGGMMNKEDLVEDHSEIRFSGYTQLKIIDLLRVHGFCVVQQGINE